MKSPARKILFMSIVLSLAGCTISLNPALKSYDPGSGYRYENMRAQGNSDSLFVILTFSGGGTRAAALAYGVLEKLRNTKITWEGAERRLLDEVDMISSVSGGSFTAAYYGLFREEIFDPEKFEKIFLYRNVQRELIASLLNPLNWFRLAAPAFGRIELAAEFYNREIFRGMMFRNLAGMPKPFIVLNATDISAGSPFTFTQDQFDLLCSDLSGVSVATAVAASSNFPIAFNSLTLENYAGSCRHQTPMWVQSALRDRLASPERFRRAEIAQSYLDSSERKYIHLLDGGIADNLGLRGPLSLMQSNDSSASILNKINRREIGKIVVIMVDAQTRGNTDFDKERGDLGLFTTIDRIASIPMASYSNAMVKEFFTDIYGKRQEVMAYNACKLLLQHACPGGAMPAPFDLPETLGIHVAFDRMRIDEDEERKYLLNLPTAFYLPKDDVDRLRKVGPRILGESSDFQKLCAELKCRW